MDFENLKAVILKQLEDFLDLNASQLNKLSERVWAFSAKIRQPRKDEGSCNKTPFFDRWDTNTVTSHLILSDPRYATEDECKNIYLTLLVKLFEVETSKSLDDEMRTIYTQITGKALQAGSLKCIITNKTINSSDIKKTAGYSTQRLGSYDIPTGYWIYVNIVDTFFRTNYAALLARSSHS